MDTAWRLWWAGDRTTVIALFSYWSAPAGLELGHRWASERFERTAYFAAVEMARRHFQQVVLVTDSSGAHRLVDKMGLHFDEVCCDLDQLDKDLAFIWALGKIKAYSILKEPFCSIDLDVILWKKPTCTNAEVFAQSPERFNQRHTNKYHYRHLQVLDQLGYIPRQVELGLKLENFVAFNMGIFGGQNWNFCYTYASDSFLFATAKENREALRKLFLLNQLCPSTFVEQWFLGATASFYNVAVDTLFSKEWGEGGCFHPPTALEKGYTHMLGETKSNPATERRFELKLQQQEPWLYEKAKRYA